MGKKPQMDNLEKHQTALLAAQGKSNRAIGRKLGRSDMTVAKVLREPEVIATKENIQERLAGKYEKMAEAILDSISEDDLLKASLQQKSISSATLLDKSRLINGQSTSHQAILLRSIFDADEGE